jgi:hypothetical protein
MRSGGLAFFMATKIWQCRHYEVGVKFDFVCLFSGESLVRKPLGL